MLLEIEPGIPECVLQGGMADGQRPCVSARAMPLSGQTTGDAHHGDRIRALVDSDFLDMNKLRSRHQGRAGHRLMDRSYGKSA